MRAYAKVNIFLKITGKRGDYHEILSRFMLVKNLFDELSFVPRVEKDAPFEIIGTFSCAMEQNTIYKAFVALCEVLGQTKERELCEFMKNHAG
jgi:4-diphosphocytidyl-2-C-methyl-D-erythritol kinase